MFRKPKKKEDKKVRQRIVQDEEEFAPDKIKSEGFEDDNPSIMARPPALLSFDHDEGADADFTLKKHNAKRVKELKRLAKLEDEADEQIEYQQEEQHRQTEEQENRRKERSARDQYLDKYRNENDTESKIVLSEESDVEITEDFGDDDVQSKFSSTFAGIPDSRAIYEAKKQRERMKNGGYIPLEDNQSGATQKVGHQRRIHEDDSDGSDDNDRGRFYSSRELLRDEEERRREEQNEFLEHEQGDSVQDPEMDEWEKQQILKAVGRHTIGQIRTDFDESRKKHYISPSRIIPEDMDMDVDIDIEKVVTRTNMGPANKGGVVTLEDILAKMRLRITEHTDVLYARRTEIDRVEKTLEENKATLQKIGMEAPEMAQKFAMYQEIRSYILCLLDCLDEKVGEINLIGDKRRHVAKSRTERLLRRRRRDIHDQFAECSAAASGKSISSIKVSDAAVRAVEREARRARRRRVRESSLAGISHEEGLSSDDEEPQSQMIIDDETIKESNVALDQIFIDALDEYSSVKKVLERMIDWYAMDSKTYEEAWVHLCIPKLCSPYVRIELIKGDILNNGNFSLSATQWYIDSLLAGSNRTDLNRESGIIVGIVPSIVEKVVIPFLIDIINDEWDPMSIRQSTNLGLLLGELFVFPTLNEQCKSLHGLIESFKNKVTNSIDEDLFTPMFSKTAIENPNTGCRSFLDRQFWSAIKLIRCINKFSSFISTEMRFELVVENIVNKVCVVGIQLGVTNDVACERKIRAVMDELTVELCAAGGQNSFRALSACLCKVADDMKAAGREFYKDVKRFCDSLQHS